MIETLKNYIKSDKDYFINISSKGIYIYNYSCINKLQDKEIEILINDEIFNINGKNFKINKMLERELLITGEFNKIERIYHE